MPLAKQYETSLWFQTLLINAALPTFNVWLVAFMHMFITPITGIQMAGDKWILRAPPGYHMAALHLFSSDIVLIFLRIRKPSGYGLIVFIIVNGGP